MIMGNTEEFERLLKLTEYQLVECLQSGKSIANEQSGTIISQLMAKIPERRGKLSTHLSRPEINLLYQLLQAQDSTQLKTEADVLLHQQIPYRLIKLKNTEIQSGDKYFRLPIQVKSGCIWESQDRLYTGKIRTSSGLPQKISFIITVEGELRLGAGHYFLADNQATALLGAGVIRVKNGKIITIINDSNHFRPTRLEFISSLRFLANLQVLHPKLHIDETPFTVHKS
ncbi:hypothetical protein BKI52_23675 [marine bacterium AO1-C]|nr:hypothetical protein BKI52_23675 [marine bacterium AO1-C]